jgi:hypothetical protein
MNTRIPLYAALTTVVGLRAPYAGAGSDLLLRVETEIEGNRGKPGETGDVPHVYQVFGR